MNTDLFQVAGFESEQLMQLPHLESADVSQAVLFMLSVPEHVQIHELTIRPVGEAY